MARCRKEHDFGQWIPTRLSSRTLNYEQISEEQILEEQKVYDEDLEKHKEENKKGINYYYNFHRIHWIRRCKKCNKKDENWLNPYDRPKSKDIKVKESPAFHKEREKKHGKNLGSKEESMAKGWRYYS